MIVAEGTLCEKWFVYVFALIVWFYFVDVLDNLQEGYKEALDQNSKENLHSFLQYCRKKKVNV